MNIFQFLIYGRQYRDCLPSNRQLKTLPTSKNTVLNITLGIFLSVLPFMGTGFAQAATSHSSQNDAANFPIWYQDTNGIRVSLCYDPNDANCAAPVNASYNPNLPLALPNNYPTELFYSAADSDNLVVNDNSCPGFARSNTGGLGLAAGSRIHMALEAAFLNATLTPGDQMVFGRLRVISRGNNGLCPASWYTFRTPYGPITLQTDQNAEIQGAVASAATSDVGCTPGPVSPCNFTLAESAPVLGVGLLHQVSAAPGYLGRGVTFGTVTGGKNGFNQFDIIKWPSGSIPAKSGVGVDCTDVNNCLLLGSTTQFSVAAKLAGPIASVDNLDFGGQLTGSTSTAKTITLSNLGSGPLGLDASTISPLAITGNGKTNFAITSNTCSNTTVPRDGTCTISLTFSPSQTGAVAASLDVSIAGSNQVRHIALNGTGILSGQAPVSSFKPANGIVDFGAVRITTAGSIKTVTISNPGTAPLLVTQSLLNDTAKSFSVVYDNCSAAYLAVGGSCEIGINYIPKVVNRVSAQLQVNTNDAGGSFTLTGSGTGGYADVSDTLNAINTLPEWYQDERGLRVGQCDDPTNTLCVATPISGALSFPTNYPNEWFYYIAQSDPTLNVSDPTCNIKAGTIFVAAALESAFLTGVAPDQGTTFGRLRIISKGGLCPNTAYKLTHPYGETIITTDARSRIQANAGTTDVGCGFPPCDYTIAISAPVLGGLLTQTNHPDGYMGDPLSPSTVTGAPFTDPVSGNPANFFKVERLDNAGTGKEIGYTTLFGVSGRLVGPMMANPTAQDFGASLVNTAAATKLITFTNDGPFPVNLTATPLSLTGANSADFSVLSSTCTANLALAHAATCTATVRFTPQATGARSAALRLNHNGGNNPLAVELSGVGNAAANSAAISASLSAVKFTDLHVGLFSESASITVSNLGGSIPLIVGTPTVTAPFVIVNNGCDTAVPKDKTCDIKLQFQPSQAAAYTGTLTIPSNASSGSLTIPVSGKASFVSPAKATSNTTAGLPSWYQDGNGLRLEPCLTQDGNCVLLGNASFNPTLPIAWTGNFPAESFYALADSEVIAIRPDTSCNAVGGLALLRIATEAAFPVLPPAPGGQTLFNRLRIVASGLCPNTRYDFTHPYGVAQLTTDANGDIPTKLGTIDNTSVLTSAPIAPGVVQWDPNSLPSAPAGYLGDARTLHPIVGSQFRPSPSAEPANYFKIVRTSDNQLVGETKLFNVAGRIAGPLVSNLDGNDFGTIEAGKLSTTQSFVITNVSSSTVSNLNTSITGTNSALFAITANSCANGGSLGIDLSCTIQVQFRPTTLAGAGVKTATLNLGHGNLRSPLTIALTGTSVAVQTPKLSVTPTLLSFGSVTLNSTSSQQNISIQNTGTGDLRLGSLVVSGANSSQYSIQATTCPNGSNAATLAAGTACSVTVALKPSSSGVKPATIVISATDAITSSGHTPVVMTPVTVNLTGSGAQGTISLAASTASVSSAAGKTGTVKLTLTNSGTAAFSLNANAFSFTAVSGNNPISKFSASQANCTNAAARSKTCAVTVSFTPPAGTAKNTIFSVDMAIASNASNNPVKVRVTGTSK